MIIGALLSLLGLILVTVLNWLPSATTQPIPEEFQDSVQSIFDLIYMWEYILPINTMITILILSLVFYSAMFTLRTIMYLVTVIRG